MSVFFVVSVICEQIVLFGFNEGFNYISGLVSVFAQRFSNKIHNFWDHLRESLEDLVNNGAGDVLKLGIDVLDELKCWILKLLELWSNQVYKNIN